MEEAVSMLRFKGRGMCRMQLVFVIQGLTVKVIPSVAPLTSAVVQRREHHFVTSIPNLALIVNQLECESHQWSLEL